MIPVKMIRKWLHLTFLFYIVISTAGIYNFSNNHNQNTTIVCKTKNSSDIKGMIPMDASSVSVRL